MVAEAEAMLAELARDVRAAQDAQARRAEADAAADAAEDEADAAQDARDAARGPAAGGPRPVTDA